MKPVAKEAKMNKAEAHEPKSGHMRPAGAGKGPSGDAGSMKSADMRSSSLSSSDPAMASRQMRATFGSLRTRVLIALKLSVTA